MKTLIQILKDFVLFYSCKHSHVPTNMNVPVDRSINRRLFR